MISGDTHGTINLDRSEYTDKPLIMCWSFTSSYILREWNRRHQRISMGYLVCDVGAILQIEHMMDSDLSSR